MQTMPTMEVKTAARPNASGLKSLVSIGITKNPRRAEAPDPENNIKTSFLNELCFNSDNPSKCSDFFNHINANHRLLGDNSLDNFALVIFAQVRMHW